MRHGGSFLNDSSLPWWRSGALLVGWSMPIPPLVSRAWADASRPTLVWLRRRSPLVRETCSVSGSTAVGSFCGTETEALGPILSNRIVCSLADWIWWSRLSDCRPRGELWGVWWGSQRTSGYTWATSNHVTPRPVNRTSRKSLPYPKFKWIKLGKQQPTPIALSCARRGGGSLSTWLLLNVSFLIQVLHSPWLIFSGPSLGLASNYIWSASFARYRIQTIRGGGDSVDD